MDGSNVYKSNDRTIIEELLHLFKGWDIEVTKTNISELDEASTSGGAGAYLTPNAFGKEAPESAITAYGMKRAPKVDKNIKSLEESNYKKLIFEMYDILEEGKYNDIKNDPSVAPKKKVNYAIAEVYTKLYEIENIISKNVKLKTEINMDNRMYWKSTKEKLSKLSERLNRVSNYLKNLSA
jgi:HD superfamily phosphohydrolase